MRTLYAEQNSWLRPRTTVSQRNRCFGATLEQGHFRWRGLSWKVTK